MFYLVDVAQLVRVPGCGPGGRRFDPDHPPHFFANLYSGVSPSGKAPDFDSVIRWFESSHPSQKNDNLRQKVVVFLSNPKDCYVITRQRVCNRRRRMSSPQVHFPSD